MDPNTTDAMLVFVLEDLHGAPGPTPALALRLARRFPQARALEVTLTLARAADGLESMLSDGAQDARILYRLATLVAVDTLVLEVEDPARSGPIRAQHLLAHWRNDPFFCD